MQNSPEIEKTILKITDGNKNSKIYECNIKESLEQYTNKFAKDINVNYSSPMVLYRGESLFGDKLKKPLCEIIKPGDKITTMILFQYTESDINAQDEINIILSIESVKILQLKGKREDIIKDIIRKSSIIKLDLKWCIFKYKENEIDINKKFDDIANDEDKKKLEIIITINYTIPLIVNYVNENKKSTIIQCLLSDRVDIFFEINHQDKNDFDLLFEYKKVEYYKIFYELISEDKIQNYFTNKNNTKDLLTPNYMMEQSSTNINNVNETNIDMPISISSSNESDNKKLEIEIRIIKKSIKKSCGGGSGRCCINLCYILKIIIFVLIGFIIYDFYIVWDSGGGLVTHLIKIK